MKAMVRLVIRYKHGTYEALRNLLDKHSEIEAKYGIPPYRWYWAMSGPEQHDTLIGEQEWESLSAFETSYAKCLQDAAFKAQDVDIWKLIETQRWEFYMAL